MGSCFDIGTKRNTPPTAGLPAWCLLLTAGSLRCLLVVLVGRVLSPDQVEHHDDLGVRGALGLDPDVLRPSLSELREQLLELLEVLDPGTGVGPSPELEDPGMSLRRSTDDVLEQLGQGPVAVEFVLPVPTLRLRPVLEVTGDVLCEILGGIEPRLVSLST